MKPRTIVTPNVTFEALEAGDGPLVLCLHGFPDQPRSFRHQLPVLAAAGFRAVAPWMRGYAPTTRPADGRYDAMALGEDVGALVEALGYETAVVFGHDWGAVATYFGALRFPHRVRKLVTAAVPYGPAFFRAFLTSPAQQRRSWYMFFFRHAIADAALRHEPRVRGPHHAREALRHPLQRLAGQRVDAAEEGVLRDRPARRGRGERGEPHHRVGLVGGDRAVARGGHRIGPERHRRPCQTHPRAARPR